MGFGSTEDFLAYLTQMQAEDQIIPPGELVRRVKAGPGPQSLGEAQHASTVQASAQQGIETDTRNAITRLENAWSGPSGDAARDALRPLAEAAKSASEALNRSQGILTDQVHAFTSTRDSLHDVSDVPPPRSLWDTITPWDTDSEDRINERNAAIQQNHAVYQRFVSTSAAHGQSMPVDYGQISDTPEATTLESDRNASGHSHNQPTVARITTTARPADRPSSPGPPEAAAVLPKQREGQPQLGGQETDRVPTVSPEEPHPPAGKVQSLPGANGGYTADSLAPSTELSGFTTDNHGTPRTSSPVDNSLGSHLPLDADDDASQRENPVVSGKKTGTGRPSGPVGQTTRGTAGARGSDGMPLTTNTGKGGKEEDKEHKTPGYLREADPSALFGYDGRATPPVIGH